MLQDATWMLSRNPVQGRRGRSGAAGSAQRRAMVLFRALRLQAGWGRIQARLFGRPQQLRPLAEVRAVAGIRGGHYAGLCAVPINQIRGSEGRSHDFDANFCPRNDHNRWRWLAVAVARQEGVVLPPVDLIRVGDAYYVRDGHHRISVARAFGQEQIDAEVTIWQVVG